MVVTLVAALSVEATFHRVIDDPALRAKPWDVRLEEPSALAAARQDPDVATATTIAGFQVAGPAGELHARAVGDGFEAFPYAVPDGRMFARPGEAIAGRGLYETLGAAIGDPSPCASPASRSRSRSSAATSNPTTTAAC